MRKYLTSRSGMATVDAAQLVAGLVLFAAPWVLGFTDTQAAAWNAWIVGAVIALVALGALTMFNRYEEWANLALGLWAVIAPWALGFAAGAAMWTHLAVGVVVAALAGSRLWTADGPPASHA
jgi:hypothetical protein